MVSWLCELAKCSVDCRQERAFVRDISSEGALFGRRTNYERAQNATVTPVLFVLANYLKQLDTHFWNWLRWSLTVLMTYLEKPFLHAICSVCKDKWCPSHGDFSCWPKLWRTDRLHQFVPFFYRKMRITFFIYLTLKLTRFFFFYPFSVSSKSNRLKSARRILKAGRHTPSFFFFWKAAIVGGIDRGISRVYRSRLLFPSILCRLSRKKK